jgi:hypothetical protein
MTRERNLTTELREHTHERNNMSDSRYDVDGKPVETPQYKCFEIRLAPWHGGKSAATKAAKRNLNRRVSEDDTVTRHV